MYLMNFLAKVLVLFLFFVLNINLLAAQSESYFQQAVAYKIEVALDDGGHYLRGNIEIAYTNNSSDTLSFLYFHLWPNAYKHQQTAFGKQLLNNGRLDFHFSKKKYRGFIDSLRFSCNDEAINWEEDFFNPSPIREKLKEHMSGERNWQYYLWNILMFESWLESLN